MIQFLYIQNLYISKNLLGVEKSFLQSNRFNLYVPLKKLKFKFRSFCTKYKNIEEPVIILDSISIEIFYWEVLFVHETQEFLDDA